MKERLEREWELRMTEINNEKSKLMNQIETLQKECDELKHQKNEINNEKSKLVDQIETIQKECEELKRQKNEILRQQNEAFNQQKEEIERLMNALKDRSDSMKSPISTLNYSPSNFIGIHTNLKKLYKRLREEIIGLKER